MAVLLPDGLYQVHHRPYPWPQDTHGAPVAPDQLPPGQARNGCSTEQPSGSWSLRLDPAEWRVRAGDLVTGGPGNRTYTVTGIPRLHVNSAASDADYIEALGVLAEPPVSVPYDPGP